MWDADFFRIFVLLFYSLFVCECGIMWMFLCMFFS